MTAMNTLMQVGDCCTPCVAVFGVHSEYPWSFVNPLKYPIRTPSTSKFVSHLRKLLSLFLSSSKANLDRFYKCHSNRQGIAVLAFDVDSVDAIFTNYEKLHPKLIVGRHDYESAKLLEVFAYYNKDKHEADTGTILRFIEHVNGVVSCPLPGLHPVAADFDQQPSQPAYCDHWVSNVYDRTGFLTTLQDTLGFTPKVDFNAGVVAAGEAQIESTVTGNDTPAVSSKELSLRNQTQVYLPINNALSNVGHVHGFLNEIGQGIQHVASRVDNLVEFVQRANDWRQITGEGFSFLRIPRSYYGILSFKLLVDNAEASEKLAISVVDACQNTHITSADGAVFLELEEQDVEERLQNALHGTPHHDEYSEKKACILSTILKSRYINLHSLLRDHISESSYLGIVQNQILVDVQGDDLLYQIFTSNVLQRHAGDEAPFLEFIQRVCSECINSESGCPVQIKPGCGGFGIRNFLTLFLSIEVSKAMLEVTEARVRGDEKRQVMAQAMVDCFTDQLDESNPILTEISDAMTRERECQDMLAQSNCDGDREFWRAQLELASEGKTNGNKKLMDCSTKYKERMVAIRSFGVHQQ